jgi:aspartate kinase
MDMEAIHSKASKEMEMKNIPIRVKNAFDPEHPGTLISCDYVSPEPRVEMICGRDDIISVEVYDPEMVGECGYDYKLLESLYKTNISYIAKNTNANTITHFIPQKEKNLNNCIKLMQESLPNAQITTGEVAIISVIGTNMKIPGFLSRAASSLAKAGINILALDQCMRQVNMQFIVEKQHFENAQIALHKEFVEKA